MATITVIQPSVMNETVKRRVAAYCRVSGGSEDQLNSYQAQLTYYSHKFEDSTTEELVDLYADEGITGTRDDKRDEFQRLMKDCRRGKIDRIYTKSISRFARNTKDCLKNLRELKALGITVFFEKENIDTANMTDEIMITILGGLAQEESVSISQNLRWTFQKKMQNGSFVLPNTPYGYRMENQKLVIDEESAKIVQEIFDMYLSGIGSSRIAEIMNARLRQKQEKQLTPLSIRYILRNEKYTGNSLWGKFCTTKALPFRTMKNTGQQPQYYCPDTHPAIITQEKFDRVQELLRTRSHKYTTHDNPLKGKMRCGECGSSFRLKQNRGITYWICIKHDKSAANCPMVILPQERIHNAYLLLHNKLLHHYQSVLLPLQQMLQELKCKKYGGNIRVMDIHKEIAKLREQNHVIARLRTKGYMDEGKFQEQSKELNNKIRKLQAELKKITRSDDEDDILEQLDMLIDYFEKRDQMMVSFEPETFDMMVDKITANQNELTFHLLGGIELKEKI